MTEVEEVEAFLEETVQRDFLVTIGHTDPKPGEPWSLKVEYTGIRLVLSTWKDRPPKYLPELRYLHVGEA